MNEPFAEGTFADLEKRVYVARRIGEFAASLAHIRTPWIRTRLKTLEQRLIKTPVKAEDIALVAECLADFVRPTHIGQRIAHIHRTKWSTHRQCSR